MLRRKCSYHFHSFSSSTSSRNFFLAEKAITYLQLYPDQLSSLLPEFNPESSCFLLLKSQFDKTLTLKFLDWALESSNSRILDPRSKCYALHILTKFKLFKSALSLAQELAREVSDDDMSGRLLFDYLKQSFHSFNSNSSDVFDLMVKSYSYLNMVDKALNTLRFAKLDGFMPGVLSYNSILHALVRTNPSIDSSLKLAVKLFDEMRQVGISPNVFTYNILIRGFSGAGHLDKAVNLFLEI